MNSHASNMWKVFVPHIFGVTAQCGAEQAGGRHALYSSGLVCAQSSRKFWRAASGKRQHKIQAQDNLFASLTITLFVTLSLPSSPHEIVRPTCTMADALKAEGNKAFAAKNFEEAV